MFPALRSRISSPPHLQADPHLQCERPLALGPFADGHFLTVRAPPLHRGPCADGPALTVRMVAQKRNQMRIANNLSSIIFKDLAMIAMKYANSARPTIAHPITHLADPMKGAQMTFVKMHGPMPMMLPFQKASSEQHS